MKFYGKERKITHRFGCNRLNSRLSDNSDELLISEVEEDGRAGESACEAHTHAHTEA